MEKAYRKYICVYAASSSQIDAAYYQAASEIGTLLTEKGFGIINGAGNTGLMQAVSDAALQNNGKVTGIIPRFMIDRNWHHKGLSELIEVETMHQRKEKMAELSDGVIALPGGCGTLEEILEIITWKQLGIYLKPIIILNINHFYDPLLLQLKRALEEHFMLPTHDQLWCVANTPLEALNHLSRQSEYKINRQQLNTV